MQIQSQLQFADLNHKLQFTCIRISEAVTWQCSVKKVFVKISQNFREKTYARASFALGLSPVISKVSITDFGHEWKMLLFVSLKYLSQEKDNYSKLAT